MSYITGGRPGGIQWPAGWDAWFLGLEHGRGAWTRTDWPAFAATATPWPSWSTASDWHCRAT